MAFGMEGCVPFLSLDFDAVLVRMTPVRIRGNFLAKGNAGRKIAIGVGRQSVGIETTGSGDRIVFVIALSVHFTDSIFTHQLAPLIWNGAKILVC
ncbi:hypothetical protein CEXT_667191 [Caerostris extrusa]|uniref:Uncharacterized protein n=1 Tax=Caerostris extrusa TaxID=172846 RepID=A0AAV4VT76_CAEEX|nr:hypothetical protein CEXT_667191 [Caerostris extrusa]